MHGKYTQWHSDGRKMREEAYRHGQLHGEALWWDTSGKLLTRGTYQDGKPWSGTFPELPADGRGHVIATYAEGKRVAQEKLTASWWW
jgi:hypothetical protein